MTESHMDGRGVASVARAAAPGASVAPPKTKLNPTAKSFVFSPSAPAWTPPAPAATAPVAPVVKPTTPVFTPAAAPIVKTMTPVFTPAVAPSTPVTPVFTPASAPATPVASAPLTPAKSVLKPSAREFVPNAFAAPFVPSFVVAAPPPPPPPASPEKPAPVEDEPAFTDASSSTSTHAEPESEEVDEEEQAVEEVVAVEPAPTPEIKEEEVVLQVESVVKADEALPTVVESEELKQETDVIGARIMFTIAQLLEMEPATCPMPESVVGTQVMATKGSKEEGDAPPPSSGKGGPGSRGGKEGRRERGLHRSNSGFGDGGRGGRGGRGVRGGRGGRGQSPADLIAMEDVVPLDINDETRWKPTHSKSRLDEPVDDTEASMKEAKAILNKLSIEKFEKLSDQLIEVAVRSIDVLSGVIDMVIAKAQMEWHFSTMYASLCSKIAQTEMPAMALDENEIAQDTHKLFRKLLLTRCQKEFEVTPSRDGWDELSDEERAEKELLLKRATLGHIRFVGELFKQRMLSSRIMHACVQRLFGDITQPDEESLECLTKLLSTIGHKLEGDAKDQSENTLIAQYYGAIKQLTSDAKLCTRVRFMLQDLLDLRKNKWVARRKEAKAMTIAEVHAEAAREAKEKAKASASNGHSSGSSRGLSRSASFSASPAKRRESNGGGASPAWKARANSSSGPTSAPHPTADADGWETVNAGSRPKLLKSRSSVGSATSDRAPRHPTLSRNISDGSAHTAGRNSFSMLRSDNSVSSSNGKSKDARERSFSSSAAVGRRGSQSHNHSERPPRPESSSTPTSPQKKSDSEEDEVDTLSPDVFKKKTKAIFEEYVGLQDLDEAVTCLQELNSSGHHGLIIQQTMDIGLEKGDKERTAVGSLLAGLYERELLTAEAFASSVHDQLEFAEDMEIDIPLTLNYLAEMLAPSVLLGAVATDQLVASVQPMAETGKAAKFMALLLKALKDEDKAKALAADVDMTSLLREGDRDAAHLAKLYDQYDLAFLL